jgi:cholesterol oxidase
MAAPHYDVVVVGSGFGGSVVAARMVAAGRSVCLLERGRRWTAAEYPRSFSETQAAVWEDGRQYGFLDYRVFRRVDVIAGAGVGGGSLHYYNVQLRAPDAIFRRPEWPARLSRALLEGYYDRAQEVIESAPLVPPLGSVMPQRTTAFLAAAGDAGYQAELVPIAVHTGPTRAHPLSGLPQLPCDFTADCLLGCRANAKNSLDQTYLAAAERLGLEIRPLHQAVGIGPRAAGGWTVTVRCLDPDAPGQWQPAEVSGDAVVVAAGTLGSTELLLRSRDLPGGLSRLPASLGRRFSTNGDMLWSGAMDLPQLVDPSNGPSITAGAWVQPPGSRHLIQVQDLGFPPALTSVIDGVLPTSRRLRNTAAGAASYARAAWTGRPFRAADLFAGSPVPHFLPYLGMGTDAGDGTFGLDRAGRLALDWRPAASMEMFGEMETAMRRISTSLGGRYLRNVFWRPPLRRLLTAHPLGGCAMADRADAGVVDHRGQVWGHDGLFVVDGSTIPGPLAVNPSLTIAAVAERAAQWMLAGREAGEAVATL